MSGPVRNPLEDPPVSVPSKIVPSSFPTGYQCHRRHCPQRRVGLMRSTNFCFKRSVTSSGWALRGTYRGIVETISTRDGAQECVAFVRVARSLITPELELLVLPQLQAVRESIAEAFDVSFSSSSNDKVVMMTASTKRRVCWDGIDMAEWVVGVTEFCEVRGMTISFGPRKIIIKRLHLCCWRLIQNNCTNVISYS